MEGIRPPDFIETPQSTPENSDGSHDVFGEMVFYENEPNTAL